MNKTLKRLCAALLLAVPLTMSGSAGTLCATVSAKHSSVSTTV